MAQSHTITSVEAFDATEPGSLSGHAAVCACGYRMATSLSRGEAARLGNEHVAYMAKVNQAARITDSLAGVMDNGGGR